MALFGSRARGDGWPDSDIDVVIELERFLEILSAASQHVPEHWQAEFGSGVPWRQLADLEKHMRGAYHRLDLAALWSVYADEIDPIERAVDAMLAPYASDPPPNLPHA
jgi:uncharacterized protein with HEPN domain